MPIMSQRRQALYLTFCLAMLFAVLEPQPTRGLSFGWAFGFWLTHIACGLLLALFMTGLISRRYPFQTWPAFLQLMLAGFLGSLAFAPLARVLEELFPALPDMAAPDDWIDYWELAGGWKALAAEWLQFLPSYMTAWILINAVPLVQLPFRRQTNSEYLQDSSSDIKPSPGTSVIQQISAEPDTITGNAAEAVDIGSSSASLTFDGSDWLNQLPPAIGRNLMRIEADLHYLNVYTEKGRVMLLGSLSVASEQLGSIGMRIHRSHWVAVNQVKRVYRTGKGWYCELGDGSRIPISRRRVREVCDRLGRDFVIN